MSNPFVKQSGVTWDTVMDEICPIPKAERVNQFSKMFSRIENDKGFKGPNGDYRDEDHPGTVLKELLRQTGITEQAPIEVVTAGQ